MNRVCSIFSQILQLIPRPDFEASVKEHKAERHARGFSSWTQLIAMLFCQLGHAQSLREITGGLAASEGKLRHLGVQEPPKRSTLSYANAHRPWQLYEGVFYKVLATCQAEGQKHKRKFRFKHKLFTGLHGDSLVSVGVRLGAIQADQRGREVTHGAGSRRLSAELCRDHRR
jgi:Domain of unknown function (DUF4372)